VQIRNPARPVIGRLALWQRRRVVVLAVVGQVAVMAWPAFAEPLPPLDVLPGLSNSRPIDGFGNNLDIPREAFGSAGVALQRLAPSAYGMDGSSMTGGGRPNPRVISNAVGDQVGSMPDPNGLSGYFWAFGQLVDHDIDLTPSNPAMAEFVPIVTPGDSDFPAGTMIPFSRSQTIAGTGTSDANPR
jgi:peroxidase